MNKIKIISVLATIGLLQGCIEDFERDRPVEDKIRETKQNVAQKVKMRKIESIADTISLGDTSLFYLQQGRDPFIASGSFKGIFDYGDFNVASNSKIRLSKDPSRPQGYKPGPFEKYELSGIEMIGAISLANGQTAALINVGNNRILTVHIGDYIGRDFGKITDITEKEILIDEKFGSVSRDDPDAWIVLPNKIDLKIK